MGDFNSTNKRILFSFVEPRYDEPLAMGFDHRGFPSIYFIDGDNDGKTYMYDKVPWITNETINDWIVKKEYLNSTVTYDLP